MAYQQDKLDAYRRTLAAGGEAALRFASCPYCNGERDAAVRHQHPSTKPSSPWDFYRHILVKKYAALQSRAGKKNMQQRFPFTFARAGEGDGKEGEESKLFVVGPMVDQSELPFRLLCRQYGATLTYTPMLHAKSFAESRTYRRQFLTVTPLGDVVAALAHAPQDEDEGGQGLGLVDRPVIVQFCGSDARTILQAARFAVRGENEAMLRRQQPYAEAGGERFYACDAVDLNLGCPQGIARRGHYGSFLMEEWETIHTILHTLHVELEVPVTAKMRIFDTADGKLDEPLTIAYAKMLRDAGASLICIHGRTRAMKGQASGLADMDFIRRVRAALQHSVPVISNGSVLLYEDVCSHLRHVGAQGHMCAEPLLWDPRLFANPGDPVASGRLDVVAGRSVRLAALDTALVYLRWVRRCPVSLGFAKAHLFKMCYHSYEVHQAFREEMGALPVSAAVPVSLEEGGDDEESEEEGEDKHKDGRETARRAGKAEKVMEVYMLQLDTLVQHIHRLRQQEESTTLGVEAHKKLSKAEKRAEEGDATALEPAYNWFDADGDAPLCFDF